MPQKTRQTLCLGIQAEQGWCLEKPSDEELGEIILQSPEPPLNFPTSSPAPTPHAETATCAGLAGWVNSRTQLFTQFLRGQQVGSTHPSGSPGRLSLRLRLCLAYTKAQTLVALECPAFEFGPLSPRKTFTFPKTTS